MRRRALALLAALTALALAPASASAHAVLEATTPQRDAQLTTAPARVSFKFGEPVEAAFGALRVYDSAGHQVQQGAAFHPNDVGSVVAVALKPGLGKGTYTATYRVISADGHPVSSGFTFSVGAAGAPGKSVEALLSGDSSGPITTTAFAVVRAIQYGAIAAGLGGLLFLLLCWQGGLRAVADGGARWRAAADAFAARLQALLLAAAGAGLVSAVLALVFEAAIGQGTSFWSAATPADVHEALSTRFGGFWGLGALAWAIVLIGLLALRPLRRAAAVTAPAIAGGAADAPPLPARRGALGATTITPALAVVAVPLLALALLPMLGGHAGTQRPIAVMAPANVVHVLSVSAWLGGIALLVLALRAATAQLEGGDRTRLLAAVVGRFSSLAGVAIALLLASGLAQSIVEVRTFAHLLDTAMGRAVLIKVVCVLGVIALGYANRRRVLPALAAVAAGATPGRAGVLLRRTLRLELALGIVALGVTGALSAYAPSIDANAGPFSTMLDVGPAHVEVTIDPARVGPNEMHMYLFDRKTGAPFTGTKQLTVTAALPSKRIAPIALSAHVAGPGHYVIQGASFGVAGTWTVAVTDRVSEFDEFDGRFQAPIH